MREAAKFLAEREKISYEEALLRFTSSRMYKPCLILKQRFGKKDRIILWVFMIIATQDKELNSINDAV